MNYNILIVEDNLNNLDSLKAVLEEIEMCKLFFAQTADKALRVLQREQIDLIMMDLNLPDIHGYELMEIIKKRKQTSNIPILLMTGVYMTDKDKKEAYRRGAFDYLLKPFDRNELQTKIKQYMLSYMKIHDLMEELKEKNRKLEEQNKELHSSYERIKHITYHDTLTGLYNRNFFDLIIKEDRIKNFPVNVIMCDLNNLKLINDALGHQKGDGLIIEAANFLNSIKRSDDYLIRWGGDEFVLILENMNEDDANMIVNKIHMKNFETNDDALKPHLAIGLSTMNNPDVEIYEALSQAENGMYRNKLLNSKSYRSSIIHSLQSSLKEKDYETGNHMERVGELVYRIAKILDLKMADRDTITLLATLHDIGKLSIPEKILRKPGKLTKEEYEVIKKHPEAGYNICKTIPELLPVAEIVLSHHEWWNGRGYPQGLKEDEIPVLARVLSIADAYDVMTHKRPYKDAMSNEEAIDEIIRFKGTQFDPEIASIFIKEISE